MSALPSSTDAPVGDKRELVEYLAAGCKPPAAWRIGTEHEKLGFRFDDLRPLDYDGPRGIRAVLEGLQRFGWIPVYEGENVIALSHEGQSVTLEPGGQFELSGAPVANLHETCAEVHTHLAQVNAVGKELDIGFVGVGFQPKWRRGDIPVMPKARYDIMRAYMPTRGNLGLDMMLRSATVQVNLDFADEADMVNKMRIALALQPVATALFANSPFTEGKPNGYQSYRSTVWTDTDPDRCGTLPFVFDEEMGFERYVDHALDVPMYFVYRDGNYVDASGQSFRDFLDAKLPALPGERPTLSDWESHLTTLFPEARLKRYIEMRGADSGPWNIICALPAFWIGLLYDRTALQAALDLIADWNQEERDALRNDVTRHALATGFRGRTMLDVAREVVGISREGLARRAILDGKGQDETQYLASLDVILDTGQTPAEGLLEAYYGKWKGSVDPLFLDCMY